MDSKKLGMFAAAALTVLAAQANAGEGKKAAKAPAAKADGEMVCASAGCGNHCKNKTIDTAKDESACKTEKGTWMTKADFEKKKAAEAKK